MYNGTYFQFHFVDAVQEAFHPVEFLLQFLAVVVGVVVEEECREVRVEVVFGVNDVFHLFHHLIGFCVGIIEINKQEILRVKADLRE